MIQFLREPRYTCNEIFKGIVHEGKVLACYSKIEIQMFTLHYIVVVFSLQKSQLPIYPLG